MSEIDVVANQKALRQAVDYLREHPEEHNQMWEPNCIIGRAVKFAGSGCASWAEYFGMNHETFYHIYYQPDENIALDNAEAFLKGVGL